MSSSALPVDTATLTERLRDQARELADENAPMPSYLRFNEFAEVCSEAADAILSLETRLEAAEHKAQGWIQHDTAAYRLAAERAVARAVAAEARLEEAQRVLAREFDPNPEDDELDLVQLAERAVSTHSVGWGHAGAEIIRRENAEARAVAAEAREKALSEALEMIVRVKIGDEFRSTVAAFNAMKTVARVALVGVRGEEKGLEAGDGSAVVAEMRPPDSFWREVPCGHPTDPVAWVNPDGTFVCHCGWILTSTDGHAVMGAPGPVVQCGKCGCHTACPREEE